METYIVMILTDDLCDQEMGFDQKKGYAYCDQEAKYINQDLASPKGKRARCRTHMPRDAKIVY